MQNKKYKKCLSLQDKIEILQTHFCEIYLSLPNHINSNPKAFKQVQSEIISIIETIKKLVKKVNHANG